MAEISKVPPVERSRVCRIVGTSPLSFDIARGTWVSIRRTKPPSISRPTVGASFKGDAFIVFKGVTKIGRLSPRDVEALGAVPNRGMVVTVDRDRLILEISLTPIETKPPESNT